MTEQGITWVIVSTLIMSFSIGKCSTYMHWLLLMGEKKQTKPGKCPGLPKTFKTLDSYLILIEVY